MECRRTPCATPCPALMLDRDGVVIEDRGYLADPADAVLVSGAATLVARANKRDVPVCIVTNPSGIDRGLYGWDAFAAVNDRIDALLAAAGARIDAIAACPFHPDFTPGYDAAHARWRKPGPAMIETLTEVMNIDRAASWLVGDRPGDIEAACAAGLAGAVHVLTSHGTTDRKTALTAARRNFAALDADSVATAGRVLHDRGLFGAPGRAR